MAANFEIHQTSSKSLWLVEPKFVTASEQHGDSELLKVLISF